MGRPMKQIDKVQFEKLCALQCTKEEICGFLDVTDKTLEKWCQKEYKAHFPKFSDKSGVWGKFHCAGANGDLLRKTPTWQFGLVNSILGRKTCLLRIPR